MELFRDSGGGLLTTLIEQYAVESNLVIKICPNLGPPQPGDLHKVTSILWKCESRNRRLRSR